MKKLNKKGTSMQVVDMTKGSPIRLILAFAVPMFIGNIFQQFYTMTDTMVVGTAWEITQLPPSERHLRCTA